MNKRIKLTNLDKRTVTVDVEFTEKELRIEKKFKSKVSKLYNSLSLYAFKVGYKQFYEECNKQLHSGINK